MIADLSPRILASDPRYAEILDFLYLEAELLDSGRFAEWIELMSPELEYRMPTRLSTGAPTGSSFTFDTEIFSETYAALKLRVDRLATGMAWAEIPPSNTRHVVSNVRVRATDTADEYIVTSNVLIYRSWADQPTPDFFSASREDVLRLDDGQFRLAKRIAVLDQVVIGTRNVSVFF